MIPSLEERIAKILSEIKFRSVEEEIFVGNLEDFSVEDISQ